jgi:hypothetical protein
MSRRDQINDMYESLQYDRMMEESARDWEIIRNNSAGTNERIWSKDSDYPNQEKKKDV